jgi:FkbH-like protein
VEIKFTCTSFLPPNNFGWKSLESNHKLSFGEFGDWPMVISNKVKEDVLVWVIVVEDILSEEILMSNKQEDLNLGKTIIDKALQILSLRLINTTTNTVVAYSAENSNSIIRYAKKKPNSKLLFEYLENCLYDFSNQYKKLLLIPLNQVFSNNGINNCFDSRNFYLTRMRFSQLGIKLIAESISSVLTRISKPVAKVLVLDCDNTIWGGVVGESGLSGILIGQDGIGKAFMEFQKSIKELSNNGLILCISSKNEEKDVLNVLKNHDSMILKNEDITVIKSNWDEKFININEISKELGVGLDSICLWDDNPIEREKVKINLTKVNVIEPPLEVVEWPSLIKSLDCFADFTKTSEDLLKVSQYKAKATFEKNKNISKNNFEFLESINMNVNFIDINDSNISRAAQLCKKTNQMNLRLVRHDEESINNITRAPNSLSFLVELKDDFGNHGIISLLIIQEDKEKKAAFLDTFLMSCRVLGRELESVIFIKLKKDLQEMGYTKLISEFISGERNTPAKKLLDKLNLNYVNKEKKVSFYSVDINNWNINNIDSIKKIYKL